MKFGHFQLNCSGMQSGHLKALFQTLLSEIANDKFILYHCRFYWTATPENITENIILVLAYGKALREGQWLTYVGHQHRSEFCSVYGRTHIVPGDDFRQIYKNDFKAVPFAFPLFYNHYHKTGTKENTH